MEKEAKEAEAQYDAIQRAIQETMEEEDKERRDVEKQMERIREEISSRNERVKGLQQKQQLLQGRDGYE